MKAGLMERQKNAQKLIDSKRKAEVKRRKDTYAEVCEGENPIHLLRDIYKMSGYNNHLITFNTDGSVNKDSMMWKEGRRSLYIELRAYLPKKMLKRIEGE